MMRVRRVTAAAAGGPLLAKPCDLPWQRRDAPVDVESANGHGDWVDTPTWKWRTMEVGGLQTAKVY
jgi:hypothetical protein